MKENLKNRHYADFFCLNECLFLVDSYNNGDIEEVFNIINSKKKLQQNFTKTEQGLMLM